MEQEEIDVDEVRRENVELLTEISHLCNRKDRTRVENIFLLGKSGAGKSALVNTVIRAIAGKYIPKAKVGKGKTLLKTRTLERYESCGVTDEDITDDTQKSLVIGFLKRLPTILDVAGRGDYNEESLEEILELIIGGYIPPGTSIQAIEALQVKYGVGALKDIIYKTAQEDWKVTKVVFVQSCRENVPANLVECLQKVLRKADPVSVQPFYTGDIYVVITRYDLVKPDSSSIADDKTHVTLEAFESVEKRAAEMFNIENSLKDNLIRWVSYTDFDEMNNPKIENTTLKFIRRMVMPVNRQRAVVKPMISGFTNMRLEAWRLWRNQNLSGFTNIRREARRLLRYQNFTLLSILLMMCGLFVAIFCT